ncbi:hypothetical protein EK21DRAFT_77029, partial [Setomelanomma holmii]
ITAYDTPSRTRSRTLLSFMTPIPTDDRGNSAFIFGKTSIEKYGPAWSCLARSDKHNFRIPVMA